MAEAALARCAVCGMALPFERLSRGQRRCDACARLAALRGPAATYTRSRPSAPTPGASAGARTAAGSQYQRLEAILDQLPNDLVGEIAAALEAEARGDPLPATPLREAIDEFGFGRSPRELQWTSWGFAAGFAANVAVAKYAQMATSAPMSDFIAPLLLGGLVAGCTCGVIGWGIAKLRDRA